jgi:hypothetical protein
MGVTKVSVEFGNILEFSNKVFAFSYLRKPCEMTGVTGRGAGIVHK